MFPDARLRRWVEERVLVSLSGFAAEEAFVGDAIDSSGSEEDFHRAAQVASATEMSNDAMSAYLTGLADPGAGPDHLATDLALGHGSGRGAARSRASLEPRSAA
jgi:hypothetical protein